MHYEDTVILATTVRNPDGTFPELGQGLYVGGQVRMDAAARFCGDHPDTPVTIVGGYNGQPSRDLYASDKVDSMVGYLREQVAGANIEPVPSLPCTHHNFVAVFRSWARRKYRPADVGVLTNSYHMERALMFARLNASMLLGYTVRLHPVVAEDILGVTPGELPPDQRDAYTRRVAAERKGVQDIESGYTDNCLGRNLHRFAPLLLAHADELLTPDELHF